MDKILIIDDMEPNISLMSKYLIDSGYDVITANSGALGIKKAKREKPDLLVLDLIMPETSGFDVCKKLRSDPETKHLIILAVTALDTKDSRTKAFASGFDDYLTKSFDKATFISKIKSLLRVKELSNQLKNQLAMVRERDKIIELQLNMAKKVQRSLIKDFSVTIGGSLFTSKYVPALDLGGDIYDIVKLPNDNICVMIGDVSGHGISAALLTAMLKMMFRNLVMGGVFVPSDVLRHMNNEFCEIFEDDDTGVYACVFCALFSLKNKTVSYANAGHTLPIFVNREDKEASELKCTGVPVGLMEHVHYEMQTKSFKKGDSFFFYTDGLMDSLYKDEPDDFLNKLKDALIEMTSVDVTLADEQETIKLVLEYFYNWDDDAKYTNDDVSVVLCTM